MMETKLIIANFNNEINQVFFLYVKNLDLNIEIRTRTVEFS